MRLVASLVGGLELSLVARREIVSPAKRERRAARFRPQSELPHRAEIGGVLWDGFGTDRSKICAPPCGACEWRCDADLGSLHRKANHGVLRCLLRSMLAFRAFRRFAFIG